MRAATQRAAAASAARYERRRPEQTPLYRLVRQHYATFAAEVAHVYATGLPHFVKDEFDAYLECGILAHGFLRLTCDGCARDTLVAFSCKRRGICPSCGTRRMAETAAYRTRERGHARMGSYARDATTRTGPSLSLSYDNERPRLLTPTFGDALGFMQKERLKFRFPASN